MFFKIDDLTDDSCLISKYWSTGTQFLIRVPSDGRVDFRRGTSFNFETPASQVATGTWYVAAVTGETNGSWCDTNVRLISMAGSQIGSANGTYDDDDSDLSQAIRLGTSSYSGADVAEAWVAMPCYIKGTALNQTQCEGYALNPYKTWKDNEANLKWLDWGGVDRSGVDNALPTNTGSVALSTDPMLPIDSKRAVTNDGTSGNYLSLAHSTDYNFAGASAWTVLAFFRCDDLTADDRTIIAKYDGTERQFFLRSNKSGQIEVWNGGVNRYTSSVSDVVVGKWYLVSVRHAASSSNFEVDLFELDGTQIIDSGAGSGFSDEGANTEDVLIGAWGPATADNMDGAIQFTAYINAVLSDAEVEEYLGNPFALAQSKVADLKFLVCEDNDMSGNDLTVTETGTVGRDYDPVRVTRTLDSDTGLLVQYNCDEMTNTTVGHSGNFTGSEDLDLNSGQPLGEINDTSSKIRWSADIDGGGVYGDGTQGNPYENSTQPDDLIDYFQALSPAQCTLEIVTRLDGDDTGPPRIAGLIKDGGTMVYVACAHGSFSAFQYRVRTSGGGYDSYVGHSSNYTFDEVHHIVHQVDMDISPADEAFARVNSVNDSSMDNPSGDFSDWSQVGETRLGMLNERSGGASRAHEGLIYWWRMYDRILSHTEVARNFFAGPDPAPLETAEEGQVTQQSVSGAFDSIGTRTVYLKKIIRHPSPTV
jgi:hypothetical protein